MAGTEHEAGGPHADADQGISTIVGDQMGVVTRGEVRQLPIYGPGGYVWAAGERGFRAGH